MGAALQSNKVLKIHFIIQKQVQFGKAIYVVGNISQLGCWQIQQSLKLSWNKNHYWTGFIELPINGLEHPIQYKFAIGSWEHPQLDHIEWEAGSKNRLVQNFLNTEHIICQNTWNMEKITLNLVVPDDEENYDYYVTGDCKQLGNWKKSLKMKPNKNKYFLSLSNIKQHQGKRKSIIYTFSFQIFRGKSKIHYYYIKKDHQKSNPSQIERQPGRKFEIQNGVHYHAKCLKITHPKGDTQIFQVCNFKQLNYSNVTDNILLGPYLRTPEDFQTIKKEAVESILSIQTEDDLAMHCLTQDYLHEQSRKNGIKLYTYAIQDMSKIDFISKCHGAIQLLQELVKEGKKVYVHCTAGVYRSPQIVALFLALTQNFSSDEAIEFIRSRHRFARPNAQVVAYAIENLSKSRKINSF